MTRRHVAGWAIAGATLLAWLALAGCGGSGLGDALGRPSPYLPAFRAAGLNLPDDATIERRFRLNGADPAYEVLAYSWAEGQAPSGLQIVRSDALITDPAVAFDVLLSYAWSAEQHGITSDELAMLDDFRQRLEGARTEYAHLFGLATALEPLITTIEDLKDRPIANVPLIEIGGLAIVDITNWWDLICTLPLNAADLCLLEPLVQELYDQGTEIEQLIDVAAADLATVLVMLDAGVDTPDDGVAVKAAVEKAIAGQRNLIDKLVRFMVTVDEARGLIALVTSRLSTPPSGVVGSIVGAVESVLPGVDVDAAAGGVVDQLAGLDARLAGYATTADALAIEIGRNVVILEDARARTDSALSDFGAAWRTRP